MKIAVIGSGGREHAIAWKLSKSKKVGKVFVLPGNGGTEYNIPIKDNEFAEIRKFCESENVGLIFVGTEDPLVNGIVDYFADSNIMVFGPDKAAAQLEGSKVFAKKFMRKYGVATGDYHEFGGSKINCCQQLTIFPKDTIKKMKGNCVIKYDGLAAGKGVFVCSSNEEAEKAVIEIKEKYGEDASFLIEEKLIGSELSILAFTDGENYQLLLPSQDHKQLLDRDKGPNTGGMGAFCPVPFYTDELSKQIVKDIIKPTIEGIEAENFNYKGVVYFGLMITDEGPKLLEYNVRLGDPETEVVLPAFKGDLLELVLSCFNGTLKDFQMEFYDGYFVDVVLTSGGYPREYKKGIEICDLKENKDELIFHAGTKKEGDKFLTNGGRVLNIVARGETLDNAIENAYEKVKLFYFDDMFFRKDIGRR
ncbi:MAG: phosphoribosylamine--glycine ligase, partial [Candidatus Cloacimonetes bacterium]|nr:phosphoribosylamine--glycine ligase [Candidatus Cloacimonadota bacterium]